MMTAAFTINNGPLLDVEAYGVELLTYSQSNQAEGQMQVTVIRRPDEPFLFQLNDSVTIYINGQRYFTGLADQGTMLASSTDYRHAHVLRDPWTVLENCQWRWRHETPLAGISAVSSNSWLLLMEWQQDILSQYFTMPGWPGSVPQLSYTHWPNITGPLSACVTFLLRPFILVGQSWDHSTLPPTMVIRNQGDLVLNLEKEKHGVGDDIVLTRRDDLKPSSIELVFTDEDWNGAEDNYLAQQRPIAPVFANSEKYMYPPASSPAAPLPGSYGSVMVLDAPYLSSADVDSGLAQFVYEALRLDLWEGTFTVQTYLDAADGGTPLRLAPGMTVNLSGGGYSPDWATMNAVIQAVELDMKSGRATVHVGASGHASLTDIMERARDMLSMRYYSYMMPVCPIPLWNQATCTLGDAIGVDTGNSGLVLGEVFFGIGTLRITVTTGATVDPAGTGTVFAEVTLPRSLGTGFTILQSLGTNAPATALHAAFTCLSPNRLRISKTTVSAAPTTSYQWDLIIQQRR